MASPVNRAGKWLGLGPNEIFGYYSVTCNIEALLPSNLIAEGQFGLQQTQAGAVSMRLHRERFLRLPNPEEIEDEVWVERAINDPTSPLYAWQMQRALKKADLLDAIEAQQREAALAAQPLPPGFEQRMAGEGEMPTGAPGLPGEAPMGAGPGLPAPENLTGQPGLGGQPLLPPTPGMPPMAIGPGVPGLGGPSGMPGGRAAGMGTQPNTQGLPGGLPGG